MHGWINVHILWRGTSHSVLLTLSGVLNFFLKILKYHF